MRTWRQNSRNGGRCAEAGWCVETPGHCAGESSRQLGSLLAHSATRIFLDRKCMREGYIDTSKADQGVHTTAHTGLSVSRNTHSCLWTSPFSYLFKIEAKFLQHKFSAGKGKIWCHLVHSWCCASSFPVRLPNISSPQSKTPPPLLPSLRALETTNLLSAFRGLPIPDISYTWNPTMRDLVCLAPSTGLMSTLKL